MPDSSSDPKDDWMSQQRTKAQKHGPSCHHENVRIIADASVKNFVLGFSEPTIYFPA